MKSWTTPIALAALSVLLASCGSSTAEKPMASNADKQTLDMPRMQERISDIGAPEERDQLLDVYDRARIKLEKDPNDQDAWLRMSEAFITEARITGAYGYHYG